VAVKKKPGEGGGDHIGSPENLVPKSASLMLKLHWRNRPSRLLFPPRKQWRFILDW